MNRLIALLATGSLLLPGLVAAQGLAVLVVDEQSRPIEGAQGQVRGLVVTAGADGMMSFPGLAPGRHMLTTRFIGFSQDVREVVVSGPEPARVIVKLTRLPLRLPAVIVTADRPGLYGIVSNTRLEPLADAEVRLLGRRRRTIRTDSAGRFAAPAATGAYLLRVWARGYEQRQFGVTVPDQGGQELLIQLGEDPSYEGPSNMERFEELKRSYLIAWSNRGDVLTRSDLAQYGTRSICDVPAIRTAMRRATIGPMDQRCAIRANEVEVVAWGSNSCFIPSVDASMPRRLPTALGVPRPIRDARGELERVRRCRPYISVVVGG
ncbi:MAG: carboxypeptidase-like regulatory domain-containing protein [Gemmatimonadales bacterium]